MNFLKNLFEKRKYKKYPKHPKEEQGIQTLTNNQAYLSLYSSLDIAQGCYVDPWSKMKSAKTDSCRYENYS